MAQYKVVLNDAGTLKSPGITGPYEVTYIQDQEVVASLGKLTYFRTLEAAQGFVGVTPGDLEIWECEVVGSEAALRLLQDSVVINADLGQNTQVIKAFWEKLVYLGYARSGFDGVLVKPINGTALADKIILTKEVV
jgi:hypothetical protein